MRYVATSESYRGLIAAPIRDVNDHLGLNSAANFKRGSLLNDGHADAMLKSFKISGLIVERGKDKNGFLSSCQFGGLCHERENWQLDASC